MRRTAAAVRRGCYLLQDGSAGLGRPAQKFLKMEQFAGEVTLEATAQVGVTDVTQGDNSCLVLPHHYLAGSSFNNIPGCAVLITGIEQGGDPVGKAVHSFPVPGNGEMGQFKVDVGVNQGGKQNTAVMAENSG